MKRWKTDLTCFPCKPTITFLLFCWQHRSSVTGWKNQRGIFHTTKLDKYSPLLVQKNSPINFVFSCVIRPRGKAVSVSHSTRRGCTFCRFWFRTGNYHLPRYPIYRRLYPCSILTRRDTNLYTSPDDTGTESMGLSFRGTFLWWTQMTELRDLLPPRCTRHDALQSDNVWRHLAAPTLKPLQ